MVAPLEAAALAVGRLDAALAGHPLLPVWMFWSQLDTARRHAEVDGAGAISTGSPRSCTACRSGLAPPCPWPSGAATSPPSRRRAALLDSPPDPGQRDRSTVVSPTFGRQAVIRAALPFYLQERSITRQPLASLTGSNALNSTRAGHDRLFPACHPRRAAHHPWPRRGP